MNQSFIKGNRVKVHWAQYKGVSHREKMKIWIGRISEGITELDLQREFEPFGKILALDIRSNNRDRFAFIQYKKEKNCQDAIDKMNGFKMGGESLRVTWSQSEKKGYHSKIKSNNRECRSRSCSYNKECINTFYRDKSISQSKNYKCKQRVIPKGNYKLELIGIPSDMTWMDLKELGRKYCGQTSVTFARTWDDGREHMGMIEFLTREALQDVQDAVNGHTINGYTVNCHKQ